jgi:hypothetical protein
MPFYNVGESAATIAPAMREPEHLGLPRASREEIDAWFNNTILALQDDPYIHIDVEQADYSDLFIVVNPETNSADSIWASTMSIQEYEYMQKQLLFEKSLAGQLFYYDPTLEEYGGFRQIYTKQVTVDGKQDYKLCVTDNVTELPKTAPVKPQHPGRWKYLFYPFFAGQFKEYKAQMKEYESQKADFEKTTRLEYALADEKVRLGEYVYERTEGRNINTFKYARDIQADKARAYEEAMQQKQQEAVNEQPQIVPEQKEAAQNDGQKLLNNYNEYDVNSCFARMAYDKKTIPQNGLGIDGVKFGDLVAMALGSPELSIAVGNHKNRQYNDPKVNYAKILDHYVKLEEISKNGKSAGFLRKAQNAVLQGIEAANKGDYSALGKIIAQGLIQNNNVLLDQKQLDDRFTIYATLGGRVLDFMKGNEQLRQAVLNHLDGDIKQLDIANAARNISNLRTEIMPRYLEMLSQYGATHMVTYRDKNGVERSDKDFLVPGNKRNVAKVCQLFNIDLQMRKGEFDLRTTEYVNDGAAEMLAAQLDRSQVLAAFLVDKNRVDRLKDPMAMKSLYTEALAEYQNKRAQQGNQKELVKEIENQPKEKVGEVSVV